MMHTNGVWFQGLCLSTSLDTSSVLGGANKERLGVKTKERERERERERNGDVPNRTKAKPVPSIPPNRLRQNSAKYNHTDIQ